MYKILQIYSSVRKKIKCAWYTRLFDKKKLKFPTFSRFFVNYRDFHSDIYFENK